MYGTLRRSYSYNLPLCRLLSRLQHIYLGQPYARVDLNPMLESTLSPRQGLRIWPQGSFFPVNKEGVCICASITLCFGILFIKSTFILMHALAILPRHFEEYTVTRLYAGFRHPDRMAPDQTVRGRENDCFI